MKKKGLSVDSLKTQKNDEVCKTLMQDRIINVLSKEFPIFQKHLQELLSKEMGTPNEFFIKSKSIEKAFELGLNDITEYIKSILELEKRVEIEERNINEIDQRNERNKRNINEIDQRNKRNITEVQSDNQQFPFSKFNNSLPKTKKNRPGQRARRELWEQLHGSKANHIQKQKDIQNRRKQTNKHSDLHPSWAAKKQQQEKQEKVLFKGKKVIFNEED